MNLTDITAMRMESLLAASKDARQALENEDSNPKWITLNAITAALDIIDRMARMTLKDRLNA